MHMYKTAIHSTTTLPSNWWAQNSRCSPLDGSGTQIEHSTGNITAPKWISRFFCIYYAPEFSYTPFIFIKHFAWKSLEIPSLSHEKGIQATYGSKLRMNAK